MARRKQKQADETLIDIVEVKDQAQGYLEENQTKVFGIAAGVLGIIALFIAYNYFYKGPRNQTAMDAMAQAQVQFERDSFSRALVNPGTGESGFIDIIESYSGTPAANLAKYYAGVSYLNLGDYEVAIDYLEDFSAAGSVTPIMKAGLLGDAYSEVNEKEKALGLYKKAANTDKVDVLSAVYLKKYAMLSEHLGDTATALEAYKELKAEYPQTPSGRDIDKYIARLQ